MEPYPLRFRPVLKQTIWGGRRLGETLGKPIGDGNDFAESWEVVDHGSDQSIVTGGPLAGKSLHDLIQANPAWLLGEGEGGDQFPLLLKYLDCNRVLSVQVHPDDAYAMKMAVPDRGKTEAWYIVASDPESLIYAGLRSGVGQDDLAAAVRDGNTQQVLHAFHPKAGDCVFIPAGTVHALGAGLLVAEIQQSSNTTFRLFDWNRVGADGQPRELHIRQSLEVTDYDSGPVSPSSSNPSVGGWQSLVRCDKFALRSLELGDAAVGGDGKFHIITVPRGKATLSHSGESISLSVGDTVLLPAAMREVDVEVDAESTLLEMHA